jgi:hypothetical protein
MKKMKQFVSQYKAFLIMKKASSKMPDVSIKIVLKEVLFTLSIYLLFVLIFKFYENLHFILLSSNLFLVGSFLLYRYKKELMFKAVNKLEYTTWYGFFEDLLHLIVILTLTHLILYLYFFDALSFIFILLTGIIGLISSFIYLVLVTELPSKKDDKVVLPFRIVWLALMMLFSFYLLGIKSIVLAYLIALMIVLCILFAYNKYDEFIKKYDTERRQLRLGLVLVLIVTLTMIKSNDKVRLLDPFIGYVPNAIERIEHNIVRRKLRHNFDSFNNLITFQYYVSNNQLVLEFEDKIEFYDQELKLINVMEKEDGAAYFFIEDTFYKSVLSVNQQGIDPFHPETSLQSRYDLFELTDQMTFEFVDTVVYRDRNHVFKWQTFYWIDDELYYVERYDLTNNKHKESLFNNEGKHIIQPMFDDNTLIYQSKDDFLYISHSYRVIFRNHYNTVDIAYHNDYIWQVSNRIVVRTFDDWFNRTGVYIAELDYPSGSLWAFYHHDERFYLTVSHLGMTNPYDVNLYVFNKRGEMVDFMPEIHDLLYLNDQFVIVNRTDETHGWETRSTYTFSLVSPDDLHQFEVMPQTGLIRINALAIVLFLVTSTTKLFHFKRYM